MIKTYTDLCQLETFIERFRYLRLNGRVAEETFGFDRYLNQVLYNSSEWKRLRDQIIIRDDGMDLGFPGHVIPGKIYIHHMNPITLKDIENRNPDIFDPENLICCSHDTHNAIHYGDESLLDNFNVIERRPNDTCPWKQ